MARLAGRKAVVTGAARGIGLAVAERLVAEGATVLLSDIDEQTLAKSAERLAQPWIAADVSQVADVVRLIDSASVRLGGLDILVNNAGITHKAELLDLAEADFDRVIAVNLKSAVFATQAAARHMIPRKSGVIINIASVNAVLAIPDQIPYSVSKAAVKQLTNVSAIGLAKHGIRVNAIGPGTIVTEMSRALMTDPAIEAGVRARTPLGRCGEPEEIAAVAAFLASDDASYITGQTIYPDGGRLGLNYTVPIERE
jgi:NAD(P)-dependent dehydrogenase (short-subunit alcohol dehydrogenase family)